MWVSDAGDQLQGFAACQALEDGLHLLELAVCHEAQGRGVGRALVLAVAAEARRRGLSAVTLTTFRDIAWNAPFYTKLGFVELSGAELDSRLAAVLKREARRGLTDRCTMRLTISRL